MRTSFCECGAEFNKTSFDSVQEMRDYETMAQALRIKVGILACLMNRTLTPEER
jgi:hypothetical protein